MRAQPARIASTRTHPYSPAETEPKVAVLLNANARAVSAEITRLLSHVVPDEDLFISRSELDARRICANVLENGYDTVFCGGGDGTFIYWVNEFARQVQTRNRYGAGLRMPRFGVLKLGTGNGIASWVNASPLQNDGILDDVLRARAGEVPGYRRLDMIEVDGHKTHFAGLGIDGKLINDYVSVKKTLGAGPLRRLFTGPGGYLSSVSMRTVPYYFTHSSEVETEVINNSHEPAYLVGPDGRPVGAPIARGEVMFRGKVMMASAGTIPFYGYGLRMFPHAGRRAGMMHLRLANVNTAAVLANLPRLWKGTWFPNGVSDFLCKNVLMRFEKEMPLQVAGDAQGYRTELNLQVASEPVEVVDFRGRMH